MKVKFEHIKENYCCVKCKGKEPDIGIVSLSRSELSKIFKGKGQKMLMITCTLCGYTEFYNLAIYEKVKEDKKNESICTQEA